MSWGETVLVSCPSRGRPDKARRMYESAMDLADGVVSVKFYLNDDDKRLEEYDVPCVVGPDQPTAWSWNQIGTTYNGDLIVLGGDDAVFKTKGWDTAIKEEMWDDGIGCLGFNDLREYGANPHICVSRRWVDILGYFAPPWFHHFYVDTWSKKVAQDAGRYKYLENVIYEHMTYKNGKAEKDETYDRIRIRNGYINKRDTAIFELMERYRKVDSELLRQCVSQ